MLKYFFLWFPMLFLAILNGAARDLWYKKKTGELRGHQFSTVSLIFLFGLYIFTVIKLFPPASGMQASCIGLLWLTMTLAFEFGFGRLRGNSWSKLFSDYDLSKGRIWIFIPIWVATAPYLFYKIGH